MCLARIGNRVTWGIALLLLAGVAKISFAASFDCKRVQSVVERLICSDPELSRLDDFLSGFYDGDTDTRDEKLRASQRSWLQERNRCRDRTCIARKYEERIAVLACANPGSSLTASYCAAGQLSLAERELSEVERSYATVVVARSNNPEQARHLVAEERRTWHIYSAASCLLRGELDGGGDGWKNTWDVICRVEDTQKRINRLRQEISTFKAVQ